MTQLPAQHHPACYPSDPVAALSFFRDAFKTYPAAKLPAAPKGATLAGIITPHIDFRVSLPAYAAAFQPLLEKPLPEVYLILGVGHRSRLEWNFDRRGYDTPLGHAECANDLVSFLTAGTQTVRHFAPDAHDGEHSIEFPLLWLQALHKIQAAGHEPQPVRYIPLLCGAMHRYVEGLTEWEEMADFHRVAKALATLFHEYPPGKRLQIIVSIDGCHTGPRFQHEFQVTPALLKATAGWEQILWSTAARGDAKGFADWVRNEGNDRYFDGVGALALLLAACEGRARIQRTYYEQWFTERDHSAVTFSSGRVLL